MAQIRPWLVHAGLATLSIVMVFPFVWMLATSVKPVTEVLRHPPQLLPHVVTLENYVRVFATAPFGRFLLNSVIVTAISTAVVVATSSVAGYVFGKYRFPGDALIFGTLLATAILPLEAYMVPLYLTMRDWHWINTYRGLLAPYLVMSFGVFIMRQYFQSVIPDELMDSARIDGASEWGIFANIGLPLGTPAMAVVAILAAINAWTAFIWPLIIASTQDLYTMEVGLAFFQQAYTVDFGAITAGATMAMAPMIVMLLIFRRYITEGISLTGFR